MDAEFCLTYGKQQYTFPVIAGAVYELAKGITVTVEAKTYQTYDAQEWVLYFENQTQMDSLVFSDIADCSTVLPLEFPTAPKSGYMTKKGDACVITMNGMVDCHYYWENDKVSATEYNFNYEYLDKAPGKAKRFCSNGGLSSAGLMPFFDVTANDCGYITAIGWTGSWKVEFAKTENGIQMKSGLKETRFYLKAGEKIRTSSTLIMGYTKEEKKHNKFRRLIKQYFSHMHNTKATREGLMACEFWGGLTSGEMKKRIGELQTYGIAFEDIWIDAGWYGQCEKCDEAFSGDWGEHTGEWEVNKRVHPQALKDVAALAQDAGMHIMLWIEPERAKKGTKIVRQHPQWFLMLPNCEDTMLYYGNQDAREYAYQLISAYIKQLDLSCYRQDLNVQPAPFFENNDQENRRGITEIKHIMGMYALWDRLLENHPHLIIDNCSGGGRRIDIETLRRSIPFFRSDYQCNFNENPDVLQVHNSNIACYLPYNGCTSKTKGDMYAIRSSYSSSWGGAFYNAVFQSMNAEDWQWARKATEEYKKIRRYFSMDFYNHGSNSLDDTAWAIWQYHDNETQSGIVMAFRREQSLFDRVEIKLQSTLNAGTYLYRCLDTDAAFLGKNELQITLSEKRSSTIIAYQITQQEAPDL